MHPAARVQIDLGPRTYPVLIGSGLLAELGRIVREEGLAQTNAFVITDQTVGGHFFDTVRAALDEAGFTRIVRHNIPAGEAGKNWDEFSRACAALLESFPEAGATPLVFLLGGGVVGDLGGFAAAIFRRGVPFVQLPTTLLAAVDSSVGGKVAVNFAGVKNIMGAVSQPRLVVCDFHTLCTLPSREVRSGIAEIIKYGVVCSAPLFTQLEHGVLERLLALEVPALETIVTECVRLKADVVEQDELDKAGVRNVLNFGHTVGHALELSADYALTHGEAIALGMLAATRLAEALDVADREILPRLEALLVRAGLPVTYSETPGLFDRIRRAMLMDKKFRDGKNLFVLPTKLGAWEQRENVPWPMIDDAVRSVLRAG